MRCLIPGIGVDRALNYEDDLIVFDEATDRNRVAIPPPPPSCSALGSRGHAESVTGGAVAMLRTEAYDPRQGRMVLVTKAPRQGQGATRVLGFAWTLLVDCLSLCVVRVDYP